MSAIGDYSTDRLVSYESMRLAHYLMPRDHWDCTTQCSS